MKKILVLPVILLALLSACGSAPEAVQQAADLNIPRSEQEVVVSGTPVTLADLSVEGMTCEMMCGGAIKKALAQVPGVSGTEIKFHEGDVANHAIVTYDPSKVSDTELVKAVQAIHEGQYKVSAIAITHQVKGNTTEAPATDAPAKEESGVSAALPELSLPNVFGFLGRLLRL